MSGTQVVIPGAAPFSVTAAGYVPQTPAALRAALYAAALAEAPGLTDGLPGTLIEDVISVSVAALAQCDSAVAEIISSLTPVGANPFLLNQLGQLAGIPQGQGSNTSVLVTFYGPESYTVPAGFVVSDGTYQYVVQDGGTINAAGISQPLYCVATTSGTWTVAPGSVNQIATSVPSGIALSCSNALAGTPGGAPPTLAQYRAQVVQANQAPAQGMPTYLRTALQSVPGVQPRLIAIQQVTGGYKVVVGGGDPYQVAGAIYGAVFDLPSLSGSTINPARNVVVTISDYPDTYSVTFVAPPAQTVAVTCTWNTSQPNFASSAAVSAAGQAAIVAYINSIPVGQPINQYQLQAAFQSAVAALVPPASLTVMNFSVSINGAGVLPEPGTGIIAGDPESYMLCSSTSVVVSQG